MSKEAPPKLTPINPFTPRQREVITLLATGLTQKQAASALKISPSAVKKRIRGSGLPGEGIFGIIEQATKKRPGQKNWMSILLGDVLLDI
ncbi:MAG: LuxR C-terminal-related transcriptional regulator [Patescibacteria group bacterium]